MSIHLGRRRAVQGLAALGAAGASGGVGLSFGQTRSLSATTYFGAWETAHRGILVPAFQKASDPVRAARSLSVRLYWRTPCDGILIFSGTMTCTV